MAIVAPLFALSSVAIATGQTVANAPIQTDPPHVMFSAAPAVLILIDGEPVYRDVEGTGLQRIVNTKPLIVRNASGIHYLKIFDGWMEAYLLPGWWTPAGAAPEGGEEALRQAVAAKNIDLLDDGHLPDPAAGLDSAPVPALDVYVSTTPAELIVTDGPPRFAPIAGTSLTYVENTTADVFRRADGDLYLLTSGRWVRAPGTTGPWRYVSSSDLPADFAHIPDSSPKSRVKVSVDGGGGGRR